MRTHGAEHGNGVGSAAGSVAYHAKTLARLELELAALEVKRKVAALGIGIGLLVTCAVVALFALGFGLAAVAAALATFLPTWLSLLIVCGGLFLIAATLALIGVGLVKKGTPPVPEQAIREAKLTTEALKSDG